jgi:site-specific recombinase XerD
VLTLYRRHLKSCPHTSRRERRCKCLLHVEGSLRGEKIRKTLDLRSWEAAQDRVRDWELGVTEEQPVTITDATKTFLDDAEARKLSRESLKKYRGLLKRLETFAADKGYRYIKQLDLAALREFRNQWADGAISAKKKLERLRSFFRFGVQIGWLKQNPVVSMRPPKITHPPTMPFSKDEMEKILWGCDLYPDKGRYRKGTPSRLKVLTLLMRYAGLRIGDAVTLRTDRIIDGRLFLYTQKTNVPVFCPLPQVVLDALDDVAPVTERYDFWNGQSDTRSITGNWHAGFKSCLDLRVFRALIPIDFATRFRSSCCSPAYRSRTFLFCSAIRR